MEPATMDSEWMGWEVHKARFLDGLFVGIQHESGTLHKFNKKALKALDIKERKESEKAKRAKQYSKLVEHYHNEYNIVNEISFFD